MDTRSHTHLHVHRLAGFRVVANPLLFLFAWLLPLTVCVEMHAQDLGAATRPSPGLRVLLLWSADTTSNAAVRYNLYRKPAASATYPSTPLNATPIAPITDSTQFMNIVPRGSDDWNAVAYALADSVGGAHPIQLLPNVYTIVFYPMGTAKWQRVQMLASVKPAIARTIGQAYLDTAVVSGTAYTYKLIRVDGGGTELPPLGANEATITAGVPAPIPLPVNVHLVIGDAKIQILWNKPSRFFSAFTVVRSTSTMGPFQRINDVEFSADLSLDLDSVAISPVANGFTDYERWDLPGNPLPRTAPENPTAFTGPANGTKYWYRVQLKDLLGNAGPLSASIAGIPVDRTPPATPGDIVVDAIEASSAFRIRWTKVRHDVEGHRDSVASYTVYRYAQPQNPGVGAVAVPPAIVAPLLGDSLVFTAFDSSAGLRSACIDSTLYYRVEARDPAGNISRRSIAVGAALKDTTRPAIVTGTTAEGFDDFIRVKWNLNTDCGVDQYLIYRALCDRGHWYPCKEKSPNIAGVPTAAAASGRGRDCGGPFALVGVVPHSYAVSLGNPTYFEDHSIPPGSPLCYAYLVKAQDHSQNISGTLPIPQSPPEIIVCEHLRDRTPPEPAIVAGLMARDSAIQVEYIGPPVQDIAAYHVFRSDSGQFGMYKWVGGMTVVLPPGTGTRLTAPYAAPALVGCDSIPLASNPYMSAGSWTDSTADRKHIYWYKVLGVDRSGNQSRPDSALAISTFTFASNREAPPKIMAVLPGENPCALTLLWTPGYDSTKVKGFFVFRSTTPDGEYFQLEGLQKSGKFVDRSVARNTAYYYRVVALRRDGLLTNLSEPKSGTHP
jgi:hypothetical protein